ncbi:MAG: hypothetical protein H7338_20245 [Candidatus Sericytochromatia bacterium]|nr:hypothetical protein [Candidatus Sericytochromatia bacterium]
MSKVNLVLALCVAVATAASGCAAGTPAKAEMGATIIGQVSLGDQAFRTKAAKSVKADIDHIDFKLWDNTGNAQSGSTFSVAKTTQTGNVFGGTLTVKFQQVPNGTYYIKGEAIDAANASLTQTGLSSGVPVTGPVNSTLVTVTSPTTGTVTMTINLKDGTGETVTNNVTINDGNAWTGTPVGSL